MVKAKLIQSYDLDGEHSELILVISLPTKLIFLFSPGGLRKVKNRKRSIRRLLRWLKTGRGMIRVLEKDPLSHSLPDVFLDVFLTEEELLDILGEENKELYNEINNRFNSRDNVRWWSEF